MNHKRIIRIFAVAILSVLCTVGMVASTYASMDAENATAISKSLMKGLEKCYTNGTFKSSVEVANTFSFLTVLNLSTMDNDIIVIPDMLVGDYEEGIISCNELLSGTHTFFSGGFYGIVTNAGDLTLPTQTSSMEVRQKYLEKMGYEPDPGYKKHCVHYRYDYSVANSKADVSSDERQYFTPALCADVDSQGKIASELSLGGALGGNTNIAKFVLSNGGDGGAANSSVKVFCEPATTFAGEDKMGGCGHWKGHIGSSWEALTDAIYNDLSTYRASFTRKIEIPGAYAGPMGSAPSTTADAIYTISPSKDTTVEESGSLVYRFKNNSAESAKAQALKTFTGKDSVGKYTNDDISLLYITYLKKIYKAKQACGNFTANEVENYKARGYIEYRPDSSGNPCYILGENTDKKVNGVNADYTQLGYKNVDFAWIVKWLQTYTGSVDVNVETAPVLAPQLTQPGGGTDTEATDKCLEGEAAESLGWIICPILNIVQKAANWAYENVVEPFLHIESGLLKMDDDNGTFKGWQIFQNFANIAAVILLLIVIVSQVTGVGIDNYGIKKILPKLIIAVVLINLSFIVCQAAVDLSNVLGKGLKDMFNGLGVSVADVTQNNGVITVVRDSGSAAAPTLISGGVIVMILAVIIFIPGVGAAFATGILMAVLSAALTMLVAVITLFALLTIRKVAVIVLVVLSPLAFACYMLPNTKKLFDKWLLFFKNMLLMFPICGLVIGGGNFVSSVILTSQGDNPSFALALAAMLAGIVPFFFVPTLLRGSMNILGNIGSRLGNMGRGVRGRATGAVRNSERFKNFQQQNQLRADETRARRLQGRIRRREARGLEVSDGMRRRAGIVNQRVAQGRALNAKNQMWGSQERMDAAERSLQRQEEESAIQDQMTVISLAPGFNGEDGGHMYDEAKAARVAANAARATGNLALAASHDARADAYIELAGKNKKAAGKFMAKMRGDAAAGPLSEQSARRIMTSQNSGTFRAADAVGFQYARKRHSDPAHTTVNANTWSSVGANLDDAISANITSAAEYAGQSKDTLQHLNANKGILSADSVNALESAAAEAEEQQMDTSKLAEYSTMRAGRLTTEQQEHNRQSAAQAAQLTAQTAAINAAVAASGTATTAAITAQGAATTAAIGANTAAISAQAAQDFESQHMMNAELREQRLRSGVFDTPAGYVQDLMETARLGRPIYKDPGGARHYDAHNNKFY